MDLKPTLERDVHEERERLLFRLLLLNKWFIIPTAVAYEWLISISPYKQTVYRFLAPTVLYIGFSLLAVMLLWLAYRRLADEGESLAYQRATAGLSVASFAADLLFVLYLAFLPQADNLLWFLFLPPMAFILLAPRLPQYSSTLIDGVCAVVVLMGIYGMLTSFDSSAGRPKFIPADLLLCLSALFYSWICVRFHYAWIGALDYNAEMQTQRLSLYHELLRHFPVEFFVVNDQGALLTASDAARKNIQLPQAGEEWPERAQPIRNAILLRFHAETAIDEPINVPDDELPHEVKIFPTYFAFNDRRLCVALIQEQQKGAPRPASILRSDRLTIAGQIAAGLAHEIGNPLGVIRSCAAYLSSKTKEDDPHREEFELIESETQRCQVMIDRLLSLASPKRDSPARHDLRDILDRSLTLVKYQAGDRVIDVDLPSHPAPVYVNEGQIAAVFVNLFLNALQSMDAAGPDAKLRVHLRTRGDEAVVDVTDEGVGISKEELEKIFDPFFTKKAKGTGLGLSIVHQIITSLGGRIDVASVEGAGSTFTVYLPIDRQEEPA